ncbi:MAG: hypothetical protein WAV83_05470 [Methanothrix sp.]|uniref:hypothetical protein n=1 Tax=Methanothrix sp. TaxID=90426 RepID=UPI003BAE2EBC
MRIIADKPGADLSTLLDTIRIIEPELWRSDERRFLLPQRLGDLEDPEYLKEMNEKVRKLQNCRYMLNCGSITNSEYTSLKDQILFGECEGFSACNHIGMGEAYSSLDEGERD